MPTLTFYDQTFTCARAMKGADFVRLLDENGNIVFFADGITDFSSYVLDGGTWEIPLAVKGAKVTADATLDAGVLKLVPVTNAKIETGLQITFVAPCDCTEVTSLSINGTAYYVFDTNGKPVEQFGGFWTEGTTVTLTLNCESKHAYMPSPVPDPTYNQTEILTEEVKTQFGFGADAIPNDVFAYLARFNLHCWSKKSSKKQWVMKMANGTARVRILDAKDSTTWRYFYYGDSVTMDASGNLSLVNEQQGRVRYYGSYDIEPNPVGKYITLDHETIFHVTGYVTGKYKDINRDYKNYTVDVQGHVVYSEELDLGTEEQVSSVDRNLYPDNADEGNFHYTYLGVPLLNALSSLRCKMGVYTGSGVWGVSDPNKLTFDFIPRIVFVVKASKAGPDGASGSGFIYIGQPGGVNFTVDGTTLSWYASDANAQYNASGVTYYYVALG